MAANIVESGGDAFFKRLDITSEDDWARGVDEVVTRYGKLNVLVNNAAISHVGTVEETTAEDWDRVMEVNAKGTFLGTKAVIPLMRRDWRRVHHQHIVWRWTGRTIMGRRVQRLQGRSPPAGQIDRNTIRPRRHQGQLGSPRRHRHPHACREVPNLIGDSEAFNRPMGRMGTPRRDRLRRGISGFRRIKFHDRNRAGDRRRQALRPVALGGHPPRRGIDWAVVSWRHRRPLSGRKGTPERSEQGYARSK